MRLNLHIKTFFFVLYVFVLFLSVARNYFTRWTWMTAVLVFPSFFISTLSFCLFLRGAKTPHYFGYFQVPPSRNLKSLQNINTSQQPISRVDHPGENLDLVDKNSPILELLISFVENSVNPCFTCFTCFT